MNPLIGTVQGGKIIVTAPSELQDGAKVRVWIEQFRVVENENSKNDREEAKRQFFTLTELANFRSTEPYPSRESLYDRD